MNTFKKGPEGGLQEKILKVLLPVSTRLQKEMQHCVLQQFLCPFSILRHYKN